VATQEKKTDELFRQSVSSPIVVSEQALGMPRCATSGAIQYLPKFSSALPGINYQAINMTNVSIVDHVRKVIRTCSN